MKKMLLAVLLIFTMGIASATTHFNAVHVTGFVNVIINGTQTSQQNDSVIKNSHPQWVRAHVRHHTLFLRTLQTLPSQTPPTVTINLYKLNKLDVLGHASVTGKNIKSNGLYLRADTTRNITLHGRIIVHRIRNYGPGRIYLRWVNGKELTIQATAGQIVLAGNVKQLRAKLSNHAVLDAQYLRANHVLIQAKNHTTAKVLPIESLRAFASDFSNVFYYKTPVLVSRYTHQSGNVLQLGRRH